MLKRGVWVGVGIIAIMGCGFFAIRAFPLTIAKPGHDSTPSPQAAKPAQYMQKKANAGLPKRLRIPAIGLDSIIEYTGLAPDGSMNVPKEMKNVAWFEPGTRPGDSGNAVIAGHYGWENSKGAIFNDIHKLRSGDKVVVDDEKEVSVTFIVREMRRYDPDADASEVFKPRDGKSHLNLITCEGAWNQQRETYSRRLVVFSDRES